ncbi:MAG: caspase family protein [Vicinamibacterales bacterium]
MPRGFSLHIGVDVRDPAYHQVDLRRTRCVNDASAMYDIASGRGLDATRLLNQQATGSRVLQWLADVAKAARQDDYVVLTYSGHGEQVTDDPAVPELGGGSEPDGLDECWCLFDRRLIDDELGVAWTAFSRGVRILLVSDSCSSGTMAETDAAAPGEVIAASLISMSACADNRLAFVGEHHGNFTQALLDVWARGAFTQGHRAFFDAIAARMAGTPQTPVWGTLGPELPAFLRQTPFTPL